MRRISDRGRSYLASSYFPYRAFSFRSFRVRSCFPFQPCRIAPYSKLFGFLVQGVLAAEAAVLVHFKSVGIVLLVLHGVVVALLALGAGQGNFDSHFGTSYS